ncbi:MAG: DUF2341 domain-containing protein [Planctomycetota bacterium]
MGYVFTVGSQDLVVTTLMSYGTGGTKVSIWNENDTTTPVVTATISSPGAGWNEISASVTLNASDTYRIGVLRSDYYSISVASVTPTNSSKLSVVNGCWGSGDTYPSNAPATVYGVPNFKYLLGGGGPVDSFESGLGNWSNTSDDDYDWLQWSNDTPSGNTGPGVLGAYDGTYYVYAEVTLPNHAYRTTHLLYNSSDCNAKGEFSLGTDSTISFWYHMYGLDMGVLFLEIWTGSGWEIAWEKAYDQGTAWKFAVVDLNPYVGFNRKMRFRSYSGTYYRGDMCLDYVAVNRNDFTSPGTSVPDFVMHCRPSGGSNTYPYDTYATAFNDVDNMAAKIAEVNSEILGGENYDLITQHNQITVLMYSATYHGEADISNSFITSPNFYIAVRGATGETPVWTSDPYTSPPQWGGNQGIMIGADYTRLSGIHFEDCQLGAWVRQGAEHVRIENCSATKCYHGFHVEDSVSGNFHRYVRFSNLEAWNCNRGIVIAAGTQHTDVGNCRLYSNNYQGISIYSNYWLGAPYDVDNVTIHDCELYWNAECGLYMNSLHLSSYIKNVYIEDNRIYDNDNAGIIVHYQPGKNNERTIIRRNIFYTYGQQLYHIRYKPQAEYVDVINNDFFNGSYQLYVENGASNLSARNNIFYLFSAGSYGIYCAGTNPFSQGCDYNDIHIYGGYAGYYSGAIRSTLALWQGASGYDLSSISSDPLWTNLDTLDFHLESTVGRWTGSGWTTDVTISPCIDRGDPSDSYYKEYAPNGGRINLGVYGGTFEASKSTGTIAAPTGFAIPSGTNSSLTYSWTGNGGEFDIFQNGAGDPVMVECIPGGTTSTTEYGLLPNVQYSRYIKAFMSEPNFSNCSALYSCRCYDRTGTNKYDNSNSIYATWRVGKFTDNATLAGVVKFDMSSFSAGTAVRGAKLYGYCWEYDYPIFGVDIRSVTIDPQSQPVTGGQVLITNLRASTDMLANLTDIANTIGYFGQTLDGTYAQSWLEPAIDSGSGCASIGVIDDTLSTSSIYAQFYGYDNADAGLRPYLEVLWLNKNYTALSGPVSAYTLANVPGMDNTPATFTGQTATSINVAATLNGNPASTDYWLFYNPGTPTGPGATWYSAGTDTGSPYSWNVGSLSAGTSYWFRAMARNEEGRWSDNCAITVWSTTSVASGTYYWRGTTNTTWTTGTNWSPNPGASIVGVAPLDYVDVVVEAPSNMPIMPAQNIFLNNIVINTGNSCTGGSGACMITDQMSGGGSFIGGTGKLMLTRNGTGANAPIMLGIDKFKDVAGTVEYAGSGNQEVWANKSANWGTASAYNNLIFSGGGIKSFTATAKRVHALISISISNGVTVDMPTSSQGLGAGAWIYGANVLDMAGSASITGNGVIYSYGNCNLGATSSVSSADLRLTSRNNGAAAVTIAHLNVPAGASVSAGTIYFIQRVQNEQYPHYYYLNGPGSVTATNVHVYGYNGSLTLYVNGDFTTTNLYHSRGAGHIVTTTTIEDLGAYTITANNHTGNGSTILNSGTDLISSGNVTINGTLTIGHSGTVVDVNGEFDPGTMAMSAGELYIADNDPTWTWSPWPTGGTVYYDGAAQTINTNGIDTDGRDYYRTLVLRGSGVKTVSLPFSLDVTRTLTIEGVTLDIATAGKYFRTNPSRYNAEPATVLTGGGDITGVGNFYSYGNCNMSSGSVIDSANLRITCRNTGGGTVETSHLNIVSGASVNVGSFVALKQYAAELFPAEVYIHGPGSFTTGSFTLYSYNSSTTCHIDANMNITGNMVHNRGASYDGTSIFVDDGAYTVTVGGNYTSTDDNGSMTLDSGTDLNVTGNLIIDGTLTIGHSGTVVDVDGEFDPTTLTMTAGELYIADNDPTWTWSAAPTGGTIYYDLNGDQTIWTGTTDYAHFYRNLILDTGGTKTLSAGCSRLYVDEKLTIESNVTLNVDNTSAAFYLGENTATGGLVLEVKSNGTLTSPVVNNNVNLYGSCIFRTNSVCTPYRIRIYTHPSEHRTFVAEAGTNVSFSGIFVTHGQVGEFGCVSYLGPATMNTPSIRINGNAPSGSVLFVGAPINSTNYIDTYLAASSLRDLGDFKTTAGYIYGPGNIVLDCGGDVDVTGASGLYITGTLEIADPGSVVDVDGEFDPTTLVMSAGNLYIADDDAGWAWGVTPTGGTIHYDLNGDQAIHIGAGGDFYYNLVLEGGGNKSSTTATNFNIINKMTVDSCTYSIDNTDQEVRVNQNRFTDPLAVEVKTGGLIKGEGWFLSYGNCSVANGGKISSRLFAVLAHVQEHAYLTVAAGGSVDRDRAGAGIFYPYLTSSSSGAGCVSYISTEILSYPDIVAVDGPGTGFTFFVDGPLTCNNLNTGQATVTIDDVGAHTINADSVYGSGDILLNSGSDMNIPTSCTLAGTLTIGQSGSFVDSDGEFDPTGPVSMSAGNLYIADNDPSWSWTAVPSGGTVHYNGSGAQTIANVIYNNLTLAGSNTKSMASTITVNDTVLISGSAVLYPTNRALSVGTAFNMSGGKFLSDTSGAAIQNASGSFTSSITGGEFDVTDLIISGIASTGIDVAGTVTFTNFDGVTWQEGDTAGKYMNFGDSTNFTFTDASWDGHDFDDNCSNNVVCAVSGPHVEVIFTNYTGAGAGEALDSDSPTNGVECKWNLAPPTDAFIYCWDDAAKNILLGSGHPYGDSAIYFEVSATDEEAMGGYYLYWGTDPGGDPATWIAGNSIAANCSSGETTYYLRVKAQDYAGFNSANITTFAYWYHTLAAKPPQMLWCEGFLHGFSKRRKITFDTTALAGDHANFPVLIKLSSGNFDFGTAQTNGEDIRFLDPDGTHLQYEIEEYDSSGQSARIWVKVPLLAGGVASDYIWIYYGNPDAVDAQNHDGVWNGYEAVFHFNTSANDYLDSSQNWNFARPVLGSALAGEGVIGDSAGFNDSAWAAMSMYYAGENTLPSVTVTVWFKSADCGGAWNSNWSFADFDRSEFWNFYVTPDTGALEFSTMANGSAINDFLSVTTGLNDNAWHFAGAVYDGTDCHIYLNNTLDNTWANPHGGLALGTANTRYGFAGEGSEAADFNGGRNNMYYSGLIDELRISNSTRSADWIKAEYQTVNNASFTTVGTEESLDTNPVALYDNTPEFSAIVTHENSSEAATHYEIDISKDSGFSDFTDGYDGVKTALGASITVGRQTPDIEIPLGTWASRSNYYYRIKFYFGAADATGSPWSETADVVTGDDVNKYNVYFTPSGGGNRFPYDRPQHARNGIAGISEVIAALNGDNNSNVSGTGTSSYDLTSTGKLFRIRLQDGTFTDQLSISSSFVTSAENNIIIEKDGASVPVINPPGDIHRVLIDADYTLISDLEVTAPLPLLNTKRGIVITADDVTVEYCEIYRTFQGVWADKTANTKVYHSDFYENECGINISPGTNADIYNCAAYNSTNIGIVIKAGSSQNASGTIRECVSHSNVDGIWINSAQDNYFVTDAEIYDCDIYNNSNIGIRVFPQTSPRPVLDNVLIVRHNRIYSLSGQSQAYGLYIDNSADGVWLYNNILYNNDCAAVYADDLSDSNRCYNNIICVKDGANAYGIYASSASNFDICNYNDIYRLGTGPVGFYGSERPNLSDWQSATPWDDDSISVDPDFYSVATADFHLRSEYGRWDVGTQDWVNDGSTSPCIDMGDPTSDYATEVMYHGYRINQGAYGNTIEASKSPPPTSFDWNGSASTDWTDFNNWWPPYPGVTVGITPVDSVDVHVKAETNMPVFPGQGIVLNDVTIYTGNSISTSGGFSVQIAGDLTGGGNLSILHSGASIDVTGELDIGILHMSDGGLYINDDDPSWTPGTATGGAVYYDRNGDQSVVTGSVGFGVVYVNLVLDGSGNKSVYGPVFQVSEKLTLLGSAMLSLDNNLAGVRVGDSLTGDVLDINAGTSITGNGRLEIIGNSTIVAGASVTNIKFVLIGKAGEDPYLSVESGATFTPNSLTAMGEDANTEAFYLGPETLNCTTVAVAAQASCDMRLYYGAAINCTDITILGGPQYLIDYGAYTITATGLVSGTGNILLDCGGDLVATATSDMQLDVLAIYHADSYVDADGEFDIGILAMSTAGNGNIYIADDDPHFAVSALLGGTVHYDRAGSQTLPSDYQDWYDLYTYLVLSGSGTKNHVGTNFKVYRKITIDGTAIFSLDNATSYIRVGEDTTGEAMEVKSGATLTSLTGINAFGDVTVRGGGTITGYGFSMSATPSEPCSLVAESGSTIDVDLLAIDCSAPGYGCVTYLGPETLTPNTIEFYGSASNHPVFLYGAPVTCSILKLTFADSRVGDLGNYTLTADAVYGAGDITLDDGGDMYVTVPGFGIGGTFSIENAGCIVDVDGEFDNCTLVMSAGELRISDDDAGFTTSAGLTGGWVIYDRSGDQAVVPETYYNLKLTSNGKKRASGNVIVNGSCIMEKE